MNPPPPVETAEAAQWRPSVAKVRDGTLSLRARLILMVALAVAVVIGIEALLESRVFERTVQRDLLETARLTAVAVADDFELRREPVDVSAISADLHEFATGSPALRTISLIEVNADPRIIASTSSGERAEALGAAVQAATSRQTVAIEGSPGTAIVAHPALREGKPVVAAVVTVSLGSVAQLRTKGRTVTLVFAPGAVLLLTLLIDWFARRLIHDPVARIQSAMRRAGAGDFSARAPVVRQDELGAVADGLNDMLGRLQDFNEALQERVDEKTAELRLKNEALLEGAQRDAALREALARAQQMAAVGQMAASVAHQVGTPLNLISGYVQMLQEDAAIDAKTQRRLAIVQEQIGKVAAVVRTMLDHSRRPDTRSAVSLGSLLGRVADIARPKLDASKIALTLDVTSDLPRVEANSEALELAILNLVNNSLDAMPTGGRLGISATHMDNAVRIQIADSGTGIPADLLPRVFEPWITTKPAGRGTGLGLSITRDVVARHGGTIEVRSEPGHTVFTIELPISRAAAQDEHAEDSHR